jgi:HD-like signal output (HDOD) protein
MNNFPNQSVMAKKTLEMLWARVRQRGDLPGFSKAISAILGAMRGEDDQEFNMTKTVLSDPALTQKVLRLANSPMYSVFGKGINTVSKAVIVLGTDAIGHLALGLKLIDGLSAASADSLSARNEMEKAVLAGHIARQVASYASSRDTEEAVVCSMLHSLGRMMIAFYLPERWTLVQACCADAGLDEAAATQEVLGLGLDEIGYLVAQQWGLPAALLNSLHDISPKEIGEPLSHADWLATVSTMSSRCANVIHQDPAHGLEQVSEVAGNYAEMLGLDVSQVLAAVDSAQVIAEEEAVIVRPAKQPDMMGTVKSAASAGKPADAAQLLTNGVADMRGALTDMSSAQLMTMALETVYKGLGLGRAVVFLRNREESKYSARMCFGDGTQEFMPQLEFSDAYQPDVFHASLANDKMIFVENAQDPTFINKLPRWWKETLATARSFIVLPLNVNRHPVGFIYGDWDALPLPVRIEPAEIMLLNELRAFVAQSVEQRRRMDAGTTRTML